MSKFLLILTTNNAVIWSQPPKFQSQANLHFSHKSQPVQKFGELEQSQITLHQQRLKNNSVQSLILEELEQSHFLKLIRQKN